MTLFHLKISSNVLWMSAKAIAHCQNSLSEKNLSLAISISRWLFSFSVGGILRGQKLDNHCQEIFKRPEESGADDDIEEKFLPLLDHPRGTKIGCHPRASQCHLDGSWSIFLSDLDCRTKSIPLLPLKIFKTLSNL